MKKFFLALLLFGVMVLPSFTFGGDPTAKRLVFMNFPETVVEPGKLGSETIKKSSNTRIFFHYLNSTGRDQTFNIKFEGNFKNYKVGFSKNKEPGLAGSDAIFNFMRSNEKTIDNPHLKVNLPNKETISGIIETTMNPDDKWHIYMGEGDFVKGIKIIDTLFYHIDKNIVLNDSKTYTYRLGDNSKDLIPGHYGYDYTFNIKNETKEAKKLLCFLNPRGGDIVGVFDIEGKIIKTEIIDVRVDRKFYDQYLNPGDSVKIKYIPTGGYNYPIELKFKLI